MVWSLKLKNRLKGTNNSLALQMSVKASHLPSLCLQQYVPAGEWHIPDNQLRMISAKIVVWLLSTQVGPFSTASP